MSVEIDIFEHNPSTGQDTTIIRGPRTVTPHISNQAVLVIDSALIPISSLPPAQDIDTIVGRPIQDTFDATNLV